MTPLFIPIARVPGPLQISTGPTGIVVASTPWMLNSSVHTASSAAITHGRYSGLQPAITALIATFSTVTSTRSGATTATMSSGARVVPSSIRSTRCSVGGTTGRPSVTAAVEQHLHLVVEVGQLDPTRPQRAAAEPRAQRVDEVRVDAHRPAAGAHHGQVVAERVDAGDALPVGPQPADGALDLVAVDDANQRRHGLDLVVPADRQVGVVDRRATSAGNVGSSCV